ncbi:mitotic deacetylase-associated SANT domain protein [Ornithorhynchus anatinus]|uniref:Mitotic deacetylase associated SANT domain protein n=1 Tax=Ornithorhynchus anatinus TaxID=9258 RepID=A0A6I8NV82_ORNAN|nr:mitotic deacetylase-associated SANT domain protein [Ornithorhynchus anatinus]
MSLQAQPKASGKRTGKRISFFGERDAAPGREEQPGPPKEGQYYGAGGAGPAAQGAELPPGSLALLSSVVYGAQERADPLRWQNPAAGRMPDRGDAAWQAGLWNHGLAVYGGQKGHVPGGAGGPAFPGAPEPPGPGPEKAGAVPRARYGDAARLDAFHPPPKKSPGQSLPLQPFQLAFGSQMTRHVFRQAPSAPGLAPGPSFPPQPQKQPALPQLQLFENLYPRPPPRPPPDYVLRPAAPLGPAGPPRAFSSARELNQELLSALIQAPVQPSVLPQAPFPRRSRRLSKEGVPPPPTVADGPALRPGPLPPGGDPFPQRWPPGPPGLPGPPCPPYPEGPALQRAVCPPPRPEPRWGTGPAQNGREREFPAADGARRPGDPGPLVRGGVIQSTRQRRRGSQEANLLTLAQKAVELASLQDRQDEDPAEGKRKSVVASVAAQSVVEFAGSPTPPKRAREDSGLVPLVIPVSVPVYRADPQEGARDAPAGEGKLPHVPAAERGPADCKPSVIVTRRRSNRNVAAEPPAQAGDADPKGEGDASARKPKQRPRPEPLFIPPKAGTFIAPPVYSNITPYQSHLRSPVRLADHPADRSLELPPYTPPPILSPVREGSGLYFNAILSAGGLPAPPPGTPKSAHRTLLRSNSAEVTPPVLSVMGEATPVSIEPRINVGSRFQAEIPPLRDRTLAAADEHKAQLVWRPWEGPGAVGESRGRVEDLLTAACSSIFPGAGTNQELALHCLHEARGDILATLTKLLLRHPLRPPDHPLADYHYTGSDRWRSAEKKLFNKGIAIYKKDFFLVQKLIQTKTVAQCVEFYYTYKKQVKIGRNGTLTFGDVETAEEKTQQEEAEVNIKNSQRFSRVPPARREAPRPARREARKEASPAEEVEEEEKEEEEEAPERSRRAAACRASQALQAGEAVRDVCVPRGHEPNGPGPAGDRAAEKLRAGAVKSRRTLPFTERKPAEPLGKTHNQENTFPCKKCGRVFFKVKSRSAHMKSHAEQEKKAAALKLKEEEEEEEGEEEEEEEEEAAMAVAHSRQPRDGGDGSSESASPDGGSDEDGGP